MARPLYSPDPRGVGSNVIEFGFVTDDDLAALFRHALCLAFPSRTEGFGIPSLEAMVHGCPITTADCASMPEVCGDAALYALADDFALWLDRIAALHANPDLGGALGAKGTQRYPRFWWADSAQAYLDLALSLDGRMSRDRTIQPLKRSMA